MQDALTAWRAKSKAEQRAYFQANQPGSSPAVLQAINDCPERGSELPISAYPVGCCSEVTLFECRSGKGVRPGQVSTAECIACKTGPDK